MLLPLLAAITLTVTSATNRAVNLAWTGATGPVVVQRKPAGTPWPTEPPPAPLATVPDAAFTDQGIDAFAAYTYRVKAGAAFSNEVTVGPPPTGFSMVHPMPARLRDARLDAFAALTRMTFDSNGDPMIAYVTTDPNGDGETSDGELWTITWNRARYQWNDGVKVDAVGAISTSGSAVPFSVARDSAAGVFGLLYLMGGAHELRLATSKDGATWSSVVVRKTNEEAAAIAAPALAMAGGRVHAAYVAGPDTLLYQSGALTDAPTAWRTTRAPHPGDSKRYTASCVNLLLDAASAASLGFCTPPEDGYTTTAWYWPVGGTASKIMDTNGKQTDDPSLALARRGATVVAVFGGARDERFFADHHFWGSVSRNGGAAWSAPAVVADDGGHAMATPVTVGVHASNTFSAAAVVNGGTEGKNRCGQFKLARSGTGDAWVTCGPQTTGLPDTSNPGAAVLGVAGNDKLYVAFRITAGALGLQPGLALWRER